MAAARRRLPWRPVEKDYVFDAPEGKMALSELFAGRSQLIVYHFMFGPDAEVGCPSCSFWVENFDGVLSHLAARDVTLASHGVPFPSCSPSGGAWAGACLGVSSAESDFSSASFPLGRGRRNSGAAEGAASEERLGTNRCGAFRGGARGAGLRRWCR